MIPIVIGETDNHGIFKYSTLLGGNYSVSVYSESGILKNYIGVEDIGELKNNVHINIAH